MGKLCSRQQECEVAGHLHGQPAEQWVLEHSSLPDFIHLRPPDHEMVQSTIRVGILTLIELI